MNVQYDLVVDFKRPSKSNTIIVSENDDRSRVCHFILVQDKQPMDMTDVVSADIIGTKPDGTVVFDTSNVEIVRNEAGDYLNELMYTVPGNITSVSGTVTMRIRILSETSKIESFDFYLVVRNSLYNEDDEIDKETYDGFRKLLEQCQKTLEEMKKYAGEATRPNPFPISITVEDDTYTYSGISPVELSITNVAYVGEDLVIETEALEESSVEKCREYAHTCEEAKVVALEGIKAAENAMAAAATSSENAENSEANALVSEGYAVGTQNGEPVVDPDSPYFHNNSKYWSELSKGGGSEVNWNQIETSGTHIADITINGETTEVYAPEGGGSVTEYGTTEEFAAYKEDPTVPVGTEYLVTDDYTEYSNDYSDTEVIIGKYFGKNLYRRVVKLTSTTTGEHRLPYDLSFVGEMVKVDAMANGYIGNGANFNSFANWGFCFSDWNTSGFNIYKGSRYGNFEIRFIIEYTKVGE